MDGAVRQPTGDAAIASRVAVLLDRSSGERGEDRVEAPERVLRLWAMLNAANEDLHLASVPPESVGRLQQVFEGIGAELDRSVSPGLAEEWHRLLPPRKAAGLAELRIEYVSLLGWVGGLVIEILTQLENAAARQLRGGPPAARNDEPAGSLMAPELTPAGYPGPGWQRRVTSGQVPANDLRRPEHERRDRVAPGVRWRAHHGRIGP